MTYYTIRITPDEVYDEAKVMDILKVMMEELDSICVCREKFPRLHFHLILHTTKCRTVVYKFKRKYFPLWKAKGNPVYATHCCAGCKNPKHLNPESDNSCATRGFWYTCKDGEVVLSKGYTQEQLDFAIEKGSALKPQKVKARITVSERIIKHGKWAEGVVPTGPEVLDAMIRYYSSNNQPVPDRYENTMHAIAMRLNEKYRIRHYAKISSFWDDFCK